VNCRYLLACNAHGEYPTKFNGGLFTFDVSPISDGKDMIVTGSQ
jgi:hypothetical protein